jgi:hypothetical protein
LHCNKYNNKAKGRPALHVGKNKATNRIHPWSKPGLKAFQLLSKLPTFSTSGS